MIINCSLHDVTQSRAFHPLRQIAVDMGYELRYIHKLHGKALEEVKVPASYEGGHEMT